MLYFWEPRVYLIFYINKLWILVFERDAYLENNEKLNHSKDRNTLKRTRTGIWTADTHLRRQNDDHSAHVDFHSSEVSAAQGVAVQDADLGKVLKQTPLIWKNMGQIKDCVSDPISISVMLLWILSSSFVH